MPDVIVTTTSAVDAGERAASPSQVRATRCDGIFLQLQSGQARSSVRHAARGFSMIDVLVSILVIGVLLAVLLPAVQGALSQAKRVQCASNVRQLGIGLAERAWLTNDRLPDSELGESGVGRDGARPQDSLVLYFYERTGTNRDGSPVVASGWDGLGVLYGESILEAAEVFYCPAHTGPHPFERYESGFRTRDSEIVGNYQYRADIAGDRLDRVKPSTTLVSNAIRSKPEYSHRFGNNMLKGDLSVRWFADTDGSLFEGLPDTPEDVEQAVRGVDNAWREMDTESDNMEQGSPGSQPAHGR